MIFNLSDKNRKWWTLLAMASALALVFIDQTALAVALPAIQHDLNLSNSMVQWVINAYLLSLSTTILLGGKIGDSVGHKQTFLGGIILFISASILCALAQSGLWLIVARIFQGIGGAFMIPSTNVLVVNAFPENERGKAVGIYIALAASFLAFGPLLGGMLTEWIGWRSVFWINFPVALTSILLAYSVVVRDEKRTEKLKIDVFGLILSIAFISSFVLGFMEGANLGWTSTSILSLFLLSILSFSAFIFWEKRAVNPLVELTLFKNPTFSIVTTVMLFIQAVSPVFVFWAIFIQNVLAYSPLKAGMYLLPSVLPILFMAPLGGYLRDKYGPTLPMVSGCSLVISSLLWIGFFCHYQNYLWLFPGFLFYGLGLPLMLSGTMATIMSTVSAQLRGIAGAIINCARQVGNSIGLAIFAGFLASINKWQLNLFLSSSQPPVSQIKEADIDGLFAKSSQAMQAISHLSSHSVVLLREAALKSYTYAFSITMYFAALFGLICLLLLFKLPRNKGKT
ncbi:MAG: DHA2 family efflux MFS transporter permease subunit [Rickettsiella sp.]|nr:DHA2 family efflux MFS transporter permease subunit [Rickettsiella sp.]